jgi:hypothetical protein
MTITKRQFRLLIVAQFVLIILGLLVSAVAPTTFSVEQLEYYNYFFEQPISTLMLILGFLVIPFGIWALVNMIALYQFKAYAPKHLVIITILGTALSFAIEPLGVYPLIGLESSVYTLVSLLAGATLALVYYSNAATFFVASSVAATEPMSSETNP